MNELTNPDHLGKPSSLPETEPTTASPHTLKPKCTANLSADRKTIQSDRRLPSVEQARTMLARGCGGDHFTDVGLGAQGDERTHPDSPGQRLVLFLRGFFAYAFLRIYVLTCLFHLPTRMPLFKVT